MGDGICQSVGYNRFPFAFRRRREYQRRVPMLAPNPLKLAAYLIGVKVQAMGN